MYLISFIILGVILFLAIIKKTKIYHPIVLMTVMWGALLIFHKLSLKTLYPASDQALLVILLGVVIFCIGVICDSHVFSRFRFRIGKVKNVKSVKNDSKEVVVKNWFLILILILAFAAIFPSALVALDYINKGTSLWTIRYVLSNEIIYNHTIALMFTYFISPCTYLVLPISIIKVFNREKHSYLFFGLSLGLLLLEVLTKAGRLMILYFLVSAITIYFLLADQKKMAKRSKISFFVIAVLLVVVMVVVSNQRDTSFINAIYNYSVASISFLSIKLEELSLPYAYGGFSWYGILSPLYNVIEIFTGTDLSGSVNALLDYIDKITVIGYDGSTFNFFATAFFRFYGDGGIVAVALFAFLWGAICHRCYKGMVEQTNIRTVFIYNLMIYGMLISVMSFIFADIGAVLALVLIYVITGKKEKEIKYGT